MSCIIKNNKAIKNCTIGFLIILFITSSFLWYLEGTQFGIERKEGALSSSLLEKEYACNGIVRIDYVSHTGKITYAADKHYATITREYNESGELLEERYYNEFGKPTSQPAGYFGIHYLYDISGSTVTLIYIDRNGVPFETKWGYARKTCKDTGSVKSEQYYSSKDVSVKSVDGSYGIVRYYNSIGQVTKTVFVDQNMEPMLNSRGYAVEKCTYNTKNKIQSIRYFDADEKQSPLETGEYGIYYVYNSDGTEVKRTFMDETGQPISNALSYASIVQTFYSDGSVDTEMYLDREGNPIELNKGQYGVKHLAGGTIPLSSAEKPIIRLNTLISYFPVIVLIVALGICFLLVLLPNKAKLVVSIVYQLFILAVTLLRKQSDYGKSLELFWSYQHFFVNKVYRLEILNNIWLFVPLSAGLYKRSGAMRVFLYGACLSILIEGMQYVLNLGFFEWDDIISNIIGTLIGYYIVFILAYVFEGRRKEV